MKKTNYVEPMFSMVSMYKDVLTNSVDNFGDWAEKWD